MKSDLMEGHCTFGFSGEFLQAASRTLDPTVMQEIADVLRIGSLALVAKILSFFVKFPPPPHRGTGERSPPRALQKVRGAPRAPREVWEMAAARLVGGLPGGSEKPSG